MAVACEGLDDDHAAAAAATRTRQHWGSSAAAVVDVSILRQASPDASQRVQLFVEKLLKSLSPHLLPRFLGVLDAALDPGVVAFVQKLVWVPVPVSPPPASPTRRR